MSASSRSIAAERRGRPSAVRLAADQVGYAVRELWRSRVVAIFTFLFPLTWLLLFGVLAGNDAVDEDTGVRVMQFVTPTAGVMGLLFATLPPVAITVASAREQGVLKRLRGTPVPAWAYLAGRIGGAVVFALASFTAMLLVGVLLYDVQIIGRTLPATAVTVVVAIACFTALGLAVAALAPSAAVAQGGAIAIAVVLGNISGVMFYGDLPATLDRVAAVLPLRPLNEALQDQFNPFQTGAGWDVGALAIMAAWGAAGAVVAVRAFRWDPPAHGHRREPHETEPEARPALPRPGPVPVTAPGRPGAAALLLAQAAWATKAAWRDPGTVFFAVALPVGLFALIQQAEVPATVAGGLPYVMFAAAGMITWGAAVAAFVNAAEAVARARERGILKRLRGTPLHPALYLAGQVLAALVTGLLVAALVLAVGGAFFDLRISWMGLLPATGVLALGVATLVACGLALAAVLPSSNAVAAAGLGILLPLGFVSDIFIPSAEGPAWMGTVGSLLPIKHIANSLSAALDPGPPGISSTSVAVLAAWLIGAGLLAWRGFSWNLSGHRPPEGADERRRPVAAGTGPSA